MKAYKDIDDFVLDMFPVEFEKIVKHKKSDIEEFSEEADAEFNKKLEEIIKDEKKEQKE